MKTKWTITEDWSPGFQHKKDVTQVPMGTMILGSKNITINDGDRIAPRKGSLILGSSSTSTTPIKSMHTFKKRDGSEVMLRSYGTVLEYYHPDTGAWENLNSDYTSGQTFGFADHNINTDAEDFVYFCNALEPYSRWTGAYTQLNGALSGGEATITVDSTLTDTVYFSGTASSVTTTTVVMPAGTWGTDIWNGFYVLITSGAQAGAISKITDTSATQIDFGAIAGLSGTPTFEIRQIAFDDGNQTLRIGTADVTYTGYTSTTFTGCSGTPAASDNAAVAQGIQEYKDNPRGNILQVLNTRMFVSGVKVAGSNANSTGSPTTLYYSAIADATDFTFASPRAADEGGVIDLPEGGGPITSIAIQEDVVYVFKEDSIHTITFSQDGNDLPLIYPLLKSTQGGAVNYLGTTKTDTDVYYVTPEGEIKSVRRPDVTDFARPSQLSDPITLFIQNLTTSDSAARYFKRKAYFSARSSGSTTNDVVLVYNFDQQSWEAPYYGWNVSCWTVYDDKIYFGSSINPEVYQAEADRYDDNGAPYESVARMAYFNYGSATLPKSLESLFMEGYIAESTEITVTARYNYLGGQETRQGSLAGTDETYMTYSDDVNLLGIFPLGLQPLAGVDEEEKPNELQKFRVYYQTQQQPFYEMSIEVSSDQAGDQWELLRYGSDAKLLPNPVTSLTKALT